MFLCLWSTYIYFVSTFLLACIFLHLQEFFIYSWYCSFIGWYFANIMYQIVSSLFTLKSGSSVISYELDVCIFLLTDWPPSILAPLQTVFLKAALVTHGKYKLMLLANFRLLLEYFSFDYLILLCCLQNKVQIPFVWHNPLQRSSCLPNSLVFFHILCSTNF